MVLVKLYSCGVFPRTMITRCCDLQTPPIAFLDSSINKVVLNLQCRDNMLSV